jgi:iron complex outermembrane receptor protein
MSSAVPADMRVTPRDRERYGVTSEIKADDLFKGHSFRAGAWYEGGDSTEKRNFYPIINSATSVAYDRSKLNYVEYERTASVETVMLYAQDEIKLLDDRLKIDLGVTWYDVSYDAKSPLEYKANVKFSQHSDVNPKLGATYKLADAGSCSAATPRTSRAFPEDAFLGSTAVINPKAWTRWRPRTSTWACAM